MGRPPGGVLEELPVALSAMLAGASAMLMMVDLDATPLLSVEVVPGSLGCPADAVAVDGVVVEDAMEPLRAAIGTDSHPGRGEGAVEPFIAP